MTTDQISQLAPVKESNRILSMDVLRGLALLLGILLMNIVGFGLHFHAYTDPTVAGGATGLNYRAWEINNLFFEGTMRGSFSILFGAGVILFTARSEKKEEALK